MKEHEKEEKRKESKTQENDAKQQKSKEEQGTKKRTEPGKRKNIKRKVTCFRLFPSSPSLSLAAMFDINPVHDSGLAGLQFPGEEWRGLPG